MRPAIAPDWHPRCAPVAQFSDGREVFGRQAPTGAIVRYAAMASRKRRAPRRPTITMGWCANVSHR